ncbi:hypothetical protein MBANPS3_006830 [Mucor bainieri]
MYLKPTSTHIIPIYPSKLDGKEPQVLSVAKHVFLCGKSSSSSNNHRQIAFLFNHATGFHKEMLHPVMKRFKDHLRSLKEYQDTDITFISWDGRYHGDSALLNEGRLDEAHNSTTFNAMDTKQLVDTFDLKTKYDFLIGVGHSLGGSTVLLAEHYFPGTFNGLCLIDPVVCATLNDTKSFLRFMLKVGAKRRDAWKDMQEFRDTTLSKEFFKAFHPEALDQYARFSVYKPADSQAVKLKCSGNSEQVLCRNSLFEVYLCSVALQNLTSTIPTQLVDPFAKLGSNVVVNVVDGTHMLPNEEPDVVVPYLIDLTTRAVANKKQLFKAML